jgi:hypothetical protein
LLLFLLGLRGYNTERVLASPAKIFDTTIPFAKVINGFWVFFVSWLFDEKNQLELPFPMIFGYGWNVKVANFFKVVRPCTPLQT